MINIHQFAWTFHRKVVTLRVETDFKKNTMYSDLAKPIYI